MTLSAAPVARRLSLLTAVVLLAACNGPPPGDDPGVATSDDTVETVFAVNVTPAIQGQINDYLEVNGDVQVTASVDVYADTIGELTALYVNVGDRIAEDQVIAEVDPSRPGQNFVPSPVTAPISGTVTRIPARVGATITQASPIAQIGRTEELEIAVKVAERFISRVSTGLSAIIRFDAYPEERFEATVTEISPVVDPSTRTLEIKLRLNSRDTRIKAGMFGEVKIITEQKAEIVKIPAPCMIRRFGETFVFVVEGDRAFRRIVNPGIEIDNKLEIASGLEPDELVVYQGQSLLEDDVRVRVVDTVTPITPEDIVR